jgi:hypothetical protein
MPIGVTLLDLRRDLRAETGQSLNPSQGVQSQDMQDNQLDRQQRELWDAYDWPHLRYYVDMPIESGEDLVEYPPTMPFEQISRIYWLGDGDTHAHQLTYGLRIDDFNPVVTTSPGGQGRPTRWGNRVSVTDGITDPTGMMFMVPTPISSGSLRFVGQAPCPPLLAATDRCILDSKAIVLFAAAEMLATAKAEVAQLKLGKAQNVLRRLLSNNGAEKRHNRNMGGIYRSFGGPVADRRYAVPYLDYIP